MLVGEKKTAGIIGLGIIGSRVATRLRNSDYHVYVWNRTPRPFPNYVASPAEMARLTDKVQIFVTDGAALLEVIYQLKPQLEQRHVIINSATVSPEATREAGALVEAAGATFIDCPFTGSRDAAEAGQLVYYAGTSLQDLEQIREFLEPTSKQILHVGGVGDATVLKVATNMIAASTIEVLSEALGVCAAHEVPTEQLIRALDNHACGSVFASTKLPAMISGDYQPHFSLSNMLKDARIAKEAASKCGLEVPAVAAAAEQMEKMVELGLGDADFSVIATRFVPPTPNTDA